MTTDQIAAAMGREPIKGFTPEPWKAGPIPASWKHGIDCPKKAIATTEGYDHDEDHANADLLAAAPGLQADNQVLKQLVGELRGVLEPLLHLAESSEFSLDGEWGEGRSIDELWKQDAMPKEMKSARAALALLPKETP